MDFIRHAASIAMGCATLAIAGCATGPGPYYGPMATGNPPRSDASFARIAQGMPEDEVRQLLGKPDETMHFPLSNTDAWDYRYYDNWGYLAIYSVTFGPDHRVVSMLSNRINSGGDHAGH